MIQFRFDGRSFYRFALVALENSCPLSADEIGYRLGHVVRDVVGVHS